MISSGGILLNPVKGFSTEVITKCFGCKVHPEYNLFKIWNEYMKKFWKNRYESIKDFEKHLARNGTKL